MLWVGIPGPPRRGVRNRLGSGVSRKLIPGREAEDSALSRGRKAFSGSAEISSRCEPCRVISWPDFGHTE